MRALIIMHVESEGPGTLGTFLESMGADLSLVRLHKGEVLPNGPGDFDAVVSMGGPMNVYEDDKFPFLAEEARFLSSSIDAGIPVIGICLGAQMIARAGGALVTKSPKKEVGWGKVSLTREGLNHPIFQGVPGTIEVLQWHEDMFYVPEGGTLLAESGDCPYQAFWFRTALGLQFHVEVTRDMLADWFSESPDVENILGRYDSLASDLQRHAAIIYNNWLSMFSK